jgi:hypothetical protein
MGRTLIIFSILISVVGCKKDNDNTIIYGYEYFPIDEGKYVIYDVVDIFHDIVLSPAHDTSVYQIKEVIGEEEIDGEGESNQKLYRYIRPNDSTAWTLKDVWLMKKSQTAAELVEENKRRIKMGFSISYDQYWDCNALNDDDEQQCYYSNIYEPFSTGALDFDSTVFVQRDDFTSFIQYLRSYEVYAPRVGKVLSVQKDLTIDNGDTLDIQKGTELFYTAIEYGEE